MSANRTEILIVTWDRDLPYLRWCLRSINQFATGFAGVNVLVPVDQLDKFLGPGEFMDQGHLRYLSFDEFKPKGMLDHEAQILMADRHCPDADFILHADADFLFREPFTPDDYFVDGKPVMLCESYERLKAVHPGRFFWKGVVAEALGFEPTHECMCRPGWIYPRALYGLLREFMEKRWRMSQRNYILTCKNEFPQGFAEANTIGAFAMKFHPEMFHWIEVPKQKRPRDKIIQFWSHSSPDKPQAIWIDGEVVSVIPELLCKEILGESHHGKLDPKV